jgi:S-DNA-T family DNA segregation ATPase FtsK/SpoIIIE
MRDAVNGKRRPVIAPWLRSRTQFVQTAKWAANYAGHVSAYHAVRLPLYAGKLALRSPAGAAKVLASTRAWVFDAEGAPVRKDAAKKLDKEMYLKLLRERRETVRGRLPAALFASVAVVAGVLVLWGFAPWWAQWLAALAVVGGLGWLGTPSDKPVAGHAVIGAKIAKLTSAVVVDALAAMGLSELSKAKGGSKVTFPTPIMRDGDGWLATVDLPLGVTAGDVMERRERLASALRRPLGCVWPEADPSVHEGRLRLWVGNQDMSTAEQPRWPLAKGGPVDLFKPVPFGTDQRGQWVNQTFMYVSGVIGAIPRMGKTVTLREILLIAALDPRAQVHAYDLKGTGDLSPLEPILHRYGVGDDPDDLEAALVAMREVREEMRRRTKVIRDLPDEVCPDSRIEPHLANNPKLGLFPLVIGVDECQVWFEHPKYGAEFEEICTDLVKRGPATGIGLFLATQRPDSKSIPTGISANASWRFCLKVMGFLENDMVLGTSSYQGGIRATTFAWSDKGIGYLRGDGADARIVRSVKHDKPEAKRIAALARVLREQAGTITGHAAGQHVDTTAVRAALLDDVATVFAKGEDRLWSEVVCSRLARLRADYAEWTPDALATALKPYRVAPKQVAMADTDGERRNRRGYRLADIVEARAVHVRNNGA